MKRLFCLLVLALVLAPYGAATNLNGTVRDGAGAPVVSGSAIFQLVGCTSAPVHVSNTGLSVTSTVPVALDTAGRLSGTVTGLDDVSCTGNPIWQVSAYRASGSMVWRRYYTISQNTWAIDTATPVGYTSSGGSTTVISGVRTFKGRNGDVAPAPGDYGISDITGLSSALAAKFDTSSSIAESQVNNLVPDLLSKASSTHVHVESDIANLVPDLAGKAPLSHTHSQSDVTGLVTVLSTKASDSAVVHLTDRTGTGTKVASVVGTPSDGCASWTGGNLGSGGSGCGTLVQVNGLAAVAQGTANFQSGNYVSVTNPSLGNIRFDINAVPEAMVTGLATDLAGKAPASTTVNGHSIASSFSLSLSELGGVLSHSALPTLLAADIPGLASQYIDWSASSGPTSIKNKPALASVATSGSLSDLTGVLPHASLPPLVSADIPSNAANTSGTSAGLAAQYVDWGASSGGSSIKNKPVLAPVATSGSAADLTGVLPHASLPALLSADVPNNAANTSGTAGNLSGSPTLPNGTKAVTQATTDNSQLLATTAFVKALNYAPLSELISTANSITGGGDLSATRTLQLVNDVASPGTSMVYGTNASGVRGWNPLPSGFSGAYTGDSVFSGNMTVTQNLAVASLTASGTGPFLLQGKKQTTTPAVGSGYDFNWSVGSDNRMHCVLSAALGGGSCDGGTVNPMTSSYDLIIGGSAGVPVRLATVPNSILTTNSSGAEVWSSTITTAQISGLGSVAVFNVGSGLGANGGALTTVGQQPHIIAPFIPGSFTSGQKMYGYKAAVSYTLLNGCTGSYFTLDTATTSVTAYSLQKNGIQFGTIVVAAGATSGTFTCTTSTTFAVGDNFTLVAPAIVDVTAAGAQLSLYSIR